MSQLQKDFTKWKSKFKQHGKQAFPRFIMLKYLDAIQNTSDDFIFKGGNLLWHYIKTPRSTIDLDFSTLTIQSHDEIKSILLKVENIFDEIIFTTKSFNEINKNESIGANVLIGFETTSGQKNQFEIDLVYALPTDYVRIKSTISPSEYGAASIENIIKDKISASYQFKSGNTRMKDFDDLWRLSKSDIEIDKIKLKDLISKNNIDINLELQTVWMDNLESSWKRHAKLYKDIPQDIETLFSEINTWLKSLQ